MNTQHEILTVDELAERLQVKPSWVYAHAHELGALHLGKYLRFSWERVLERLGLERSLLQSRNNDQVKTAESNLHHVGGTQPKNGSLFG